MIHFSFLPVLSGNFCTPSIATVLILYLCYFLSYGWGLISFPFYELIMQMESIKIFIILIYLV